MMLASDSRVPRLGITASTAASLLITASGRVAGLGEAPERRLQVVRVLA